MAHVTPTCLLTGEGVSLRPLALGTKIAWPSLARFVLGAEHYAQSMPTLSAKHQALSVVYGCPTRLLPCAVRNAPGTRYYPTGY